MVIKTTHYDREQLLQLLDGQLSEAVEAKVTAHVETCAECQFELESLAGGQSWWTGTREALSDVGESCESSGDVMNCDGGGDISGKPRIRLRSSVKHDQFAETSTVAIPLDFL